MITCPKCSKENHDHYKFCLGCGSDLPRAAAPASATPPAGVAAAAEPMAPSEESSETSATDTGQSMPIVEGDAATAPSPPPTEPPPPAIEEHHNPEAAVMGGAAAANVASEAAMSTTTTTTTSAAQDEPSGTDDIACSHCGASIPPGFAFCGSCGTPLSGDAPAPRIADADTSAQPASLVLIQPDGSEGGIVEIPPTEVAVGRDAGGFFETDAYLSPRHAVFRSLGDQIVVRDESSLNGVFKKIMPNEPVEIKSGDVFRMGQELILFESIDKGSDAPDGTKRMGTPIEGLWGRISLIVAKGRLGNAFPIGGEGVICGRERGNILFPEDGYISGVHLRIHAEAGQFFVTDLGSSNGSYLKLTQETALNNGDFILMGAQLFRIQT